MISYGIQIQLPHIVKSHISERGVLLEEFLREINQERKGTKYKQLSMRAIAVKVGHIPTGDLYHLASICRSEKLRGRSYSKVWFGSLKVK